MADQRRGGPGRATDDRSSRRGGEDPRRQGHWVERWGLRGRMALAVGLPVLLVVVSAIFVSVEVSDLQDLHEEQSAERQELVTVIDLDRGFSNLVGASQRYVLTADTQNRSRLQSQLSSFEASLEDRQGTLDDPGNRGAAQAMEENATAYIELVRRAQGEVEDGNLERARQILTSQAADRLRTNTEDGLQTLRQNERQELQRQEAALANAQDDLQRGLVFVSLGVLVASGLVGWAVTNRTRSTVERHADSLDERLDRLETVCDRAVDQVEAQQSSVQETRSAVEDAERIGGGIEDRVTQAAQMATTISDWAQEGHRRIDATLAAIDEAEGDTATVTDTVLELSDRVDQVQDVAADVAAIAGQIDMLALNASVEASRLGDDVEELGEVRALAERTETRAQRIEEIVEEARDDADVAVLAIERSDEALEKVRSNVGEAEDWVEQLEASLEDNREQIEAIRSVAEEQVAALEEAMGALSASRDRGEEMAETNERARRLVAELEEIARGLQTMTGGER